MKLVSQGRADTLVTVEYSVGVDRNDLELCDCTQDKFSLKIIQIMLHYFQGRQEGRITRNGDVFKLDLSLHEGEASGSCGRSGQLNYYLRVCPPESNIGAARDLDHMVLDRMVAILGVRKFLPGTYR
jgi:hypothetical protein